MKRSFFEFSFKRGGVIFNFVLYLRRPAAGKPARRRRKPQRRRDRRKRQRQHRQTQPSRQMRRTRRTAHAERRPQEEGTRHRTETQRLTYGGSPAPAARIYQSGARERERFQRYFLSPRHAAKRQ
jgi:hypothetical protein